MLTQLRQSCNSLRLVTFLVTIVLGSLSQLSAQDSAKSLRQSQKVFSNEIRPILESGCADCHWGEGADAGFDLEPYTDVAKILDHRVEWQLSLIHI